MRMWLFLYLNSHTPRSHLGEWMYDRLHSWYYRREEEGQ